MERDDDGSEQARAARGYGIKRKFGTGAPGVPRLILTTEAPGEVIVRHNPPFISSYMEEISFWIDTKQAPCLFKYKNIVKKESEQSQSSRCGQLDRTGHQAMWTVYSDLARQLRKELSITEVKKSAGRTEQCVSKYPARVKTGFAARFSGTDSDSAPLNQLSISLSILKHS